LYQKCPFFTQIRRPQYVTIVVQPLVDIISAEQKLHDFSSFLSVQQHFWACRFLFTVPVSKRCHRLIFWLVLTRGLKETFGVGRKMSLAVLLLTLAARCLYSGLAAHTSRKMSLVGLLLTLAERCL
jgi:hypothetical protein